MAEECGWIHDIFNKLPRYHFPFNEENIPLNGIYMLFEKGERGHGADRIVRVGTHTGKDQLRSRIRQHFAAENKDRSIFRKNIGRALLSRDNDPFLQCWELDLTTKVSKNRHVKDIDKGKQAQVEEAVTHYLRKNFSFVVIPIKDKKTRLALESKIISTVSLCNECQPSPKWLGRYSPKEKIRNSGLWLVNELNKTPLTEKEIKRYF